MLMEIYYAVSETLFSIVDYSYHPPFYLSVPFLSVNALNSALKIPTMEQKHQCPWHGIPQCIVLNCSSSSS